MLDSVDWLFGLYDFNNLMITLVVTIIYLILMNHTSFAATLKPVTKTIFRSIYLMMQF